MTKQNFLDSLRRSLSGGLDYNTVNEHIRYYSDYIDSQIRQGKTEEQVMEELGDPRLIARTLLEVEETENVTEEYDYVDEEEEQDSSRYFNINGRTFRMPGWLFTLIICLIIFGVLTLVFTVTSALLPYLFPILVIFLFYRLIRSIFR
jgi:uncharacterized membrane protein